MELRRLILAACYGIALAQDSTSSSVSSGSSSSDSSSDSDSSSATTTTSDSSSASSSGDSSSTGADSDSSSSSTSGSSSQSSASTTSKASSSSSSRSSTSSRPKASSVTASFSIGIPSNDGNPFIVSTTLPEGTLFIACGSILLGIFLAVAAWRLSEMYSHRKATQFTQEKYQELSDTAPKMHKVDADYDLTIPGTFNAAPQLFFSPTANVMQNGSIGPMVSTTSNTYLPAGYYNSQRGGEDRSGASDSVGYSNSPSLAPVNTGTGDAVPSASSSHAQLPTPQRANQRKPQRPPSEFLNDLLSH